MGCLSILRQGRSSRQVARQKNLRREMSIEPLTMGRIGGAASASCGASRKALIMGAGLLTPLGRTASETWDALLAGRFITDHVRAAGEFDDGSPRVIQMARRVADQGIADAGWWGNDDFAPVVGASKRTVENWLPPTIPPPHMGYLTYVTGGVH